MKIMLSILRLKHLFVFLIAFGLSGCIADVPGFYVKYKTISLETVADPDDIRTYRIPIDNYDDYWTFPNGAAYIHIKAEVPGYEFIRGDVEEKSRRKILITISNIKENSRKKKLPSHILIGKTGSLLEHYKRPICKFGYKYSYNTPVEKILKDCTGFDETWDYYLTPEMDDGRVNWMSCILNCTIKTVYDGVGVTYYFSKDHIDNWQDIDAKVMKIINSYRK